MGAILEVRERNGLTKDTLVLFTSDNGPVADDGYRDEVREKVGDHRPAGPLRGGKYGIFEGGTRVPFVVRWPGRVKPGVSDSLVGQVDFAATLADLVGRPFDAATAPDSRHVLPAWLGDSPTGRTTLVKHAGGLALRQGNWKYIPKRPGPKHWDTTDTDTGNLPEPQLYDLAADLGETRNLALSQPDKVKELQALLDAEWAR